MPAALFRDEGIVRLGCSVIWGDENIPTTGPIGLRNTGSPVALFTVCVFLIVHDNEGSFSEYDYGNFQRAVYAESWVVRGELNRISDGTKP